MELQDLLSSLRERASFGPFREASRHYDLPVSTGWDKVVSKFEELDGDELANAKDALARILVSLTLYDDKAVQFFKVSKSVGENLAALMPNFVSSKSKFHKLFPLGLSEDELKASGLADVVPVACLERKNGLSLVACSRVYETLRDTLSVEELNTEEARAAFEGYDQIIALRRIARQQFDVIAVHPSRRIVEIRTSMFTLPLHKDIEARIKRVRDNFNKWVQDETGAANVLEKRVNVFPAIERLYKADDGGVIDSAILAGTGLNRHERMPRKKDLRKEASHVAGENAAQLQDRYQIAKNWDSKYHKLKPELAIPGSTTVAMAEKQVLHTVYVTKCVFGSDYKLVRSKLMRELKSGKQGGAASTS